MAPGMTEPGILSEGRERRLGAHERRVEVMRSPHFSRRPLSRNVVASKRRKRRRAERVSTALSLETLEDRRLLAITAAIPPAVSNGLDFLLTVTPDEIKNVIPAEINQFPGTTLAYQAFPQEVNDVSIDGNAFNFFLLLNEDGANVPILRLGPAINEDLIEQIKVGIVDIVGDVEFPVSQLAGFDLPSSSAIVPNPQAILQFFPFFDDIANGINAFLDFGIPDITIPEVRFPALTIPDLGVVCPCEIIPEFTLIPELTLFPGLTVADVLPDPLVDVVKGIASFIEDVAPGGIYISTLDGNDTIDASDLSGITQALFGGTGNDTIRPGGGEQLIEALGIPEIPGLPQPAINVFGGAGRDTIVLNRRFDVDDFNVDGGPGNDVLLIEGSDGNDIFELTVDANGQLTQVRFLAPNPSGGSTTNARQRLTLPSNTVGGAFRLAFDFASTVETTPLLPFDATATQIQLALEALTNIGVNNVRVTGPAGGPWDIEFVNSLGGKPVPRLIPDGGQLERLGGDLTVIRTLEGDPLRGTNEAQRITLPTEADGSRFINGGTFTLAFRGDVTAPIEYSASPQDLQRALEGLSSIDPGDVRVVGFSGGPWMVEFQGNLALTPQPEFVPDGSRLTGGVSATVSEVDGEARGFTLTLPDPRPSYPSLGGTFTLSLGGDTTAPISADASAAEVESALERLSSIGSGNVTVRGNAGGPWDIELTGPAGRAGGPLLARDASELEGGVTLSVDETTAGSGVNEIQRIVPPVASGGTFRLTFDNGRIARTTAPIPYDATVSEVQAALEALTSIGGADNVIVSNTDGGPWDVEFTGELAASEQIELLVDGSALVFAVQPPVATELVAGGAGTNEKQSLSAPAATGGTFTLSFFDGTTTATTAPIPFDATAAQIENALGALFNIGGGNVAVSGTDGGPWTVEFVGLLGDTNFDLLGVDGSGLTGLPVVSELRSHVAGANEVQRISFTPAAGGGDFTLTFDGFTTAALPYDATAAQVQAALQTLPPLRHGLIRVTSSSTTGGPWDVEFAGRLAATDVSLISGDGSRLTGGFADSEITIVPDATRPGVNEVQTIAFSAPPADPQAGTFRVSFSGGGRSQTTSDIPYNASPAVLRAALEQLDNIGAGNVVVTGSAGGPWSVEFTGELASTNVPRLSVQTAGLSRNEPIEVVEVQAAGPTNELQTVTLPAYTSGGTWTLQFDDGATTDTTAPIPYDAAPSDVQAALEALANIHAGDVRVRGGVGDPSVREETAGGGVRNEVQLVTLSPFALGGSFTLSFGGETTVALRFDATAQDVENALQGLSTIGTGNAQVTGADGGPFSIEFTGALGNADQPLLVADGADLTQLSNGPWEIEFVGRFAASPQLPLVADGTQLRLTGLNPRVAETAQGSNGEPVVLKTTKFSSLISVEQFRIEGNGGDDTLIVRGAPDFELGVYFDGGDGTDYMQLISQSDTPSFVSPIFPDSTQAILTMDGRSIQFADVEGGITLDAGGKAGSLVYSGTDEANELRFAGSDVDTATLANDGQVTTTLTGFGDGSRLTIRGEQGDDVISVAPQSFTRFDRITVIGGGPSGGDSILLEGTADDDQFTLTPSDVDTKAGVAEINGVVVEYRGIEQVGIEGLQGVDALTVREPTAGSNDNILFNPAVANDGSFQWTAQPSTAATALAYYPVTFGSIETRVFDTGSGTDVLTASTDELPGVNSSVRAIGGNGSTQVIFGDQPTTFVHQTDGSDLLSLEVGTTVDDVTVEPGTGVEIAVNTSVGNDLLVYQAADGLPISVDLASSRIEQPAFGGVSFTSTERIVIAGGDGNDLNISGLASENRFDYTPQAPQAGQVRLAGTGPSIEFRRITGTLTLVGGSAVSDAVSVTGSNTPDAMFVDLGQRVVRTVDVDGRELKAAKLDTSIEVVRMSGGGGDDLFRVQTTDAAADLLQVHVDGGSPDASDRLVFVDGDDGNLVLHRQGPIDRSGSISIDDQPPISYANIERVDVLPRDPVSGGTGSDGAGKTVVLDTDVFEHNDSRLTATSFEDLAEATSRPNIDPPARLDPFGEPLPGDEDWYRYEAERTGTLKFELQFDPIGPLANGAAGLPGDGQLRVDLYADDGSPIDRLPGEGPQSHTIGVETGKSYYVRVRGAVPEAVNDYGLQVTALDDAGPRVTGVYLTADPDYDLFAPKPTSGPTPAAKSLTVAIEDLVERRPGFLYEALDEAIAGTPGHYRLVGDHSGPIAIESVTVVNHPPVAGSTATATIELTFFEPLPDDRFTLTVADDLVDPVGNPLDGESTSDTPRSVLLPSGDGVAGGDFVARFTIDSRPELGVTAATRVYIDINGDTRFNPAGTGDVTNRDLIFQFGTVADAYFAGDFNNPGTAPSSGFDKLGAFGWDSLAQKYRFLLDLNHNGVPDWLSYTDIDASGLPVAGDFDPNHPGDEIGLFTGDRWYLDTNGDNQLSAVTDTVVVTTMRGIPMVGDVNGDGRDDLMTYDAANDVFSIDLDRDGTADDAIEFGIPDFVERPVVGDINLDGVDDLGLWVAGSQEKIGEGKAEWYFLVSDDSLQEDSGALPLASPLFTPYSPDPLGNDLFANFGDRHALPIFGNFDPPVAEDLPGTAKSAQPLSYTNPSLAADVSGDRLVTPIDALLVINHLNEGGARALPSMMAEFAVTAPYVDVNGDLAISPVDALIVITVLNGQNAAEGEWSGPLEPLQVSPFMAVARTSRSVGLAENRSMQPLRIAESPRQGTYLVGNPIDNSLDDDFDWDQWNEESDELEETLAMLFDFE